MTFRTRVSRAASRPTAAIAAIGALTMAVAVGAASAATADSTDDPNLTQSLDELAIVHGERVLETGHVDMGPKLEADGTWRFLIHDDVAKADADATSVWRYPEETVFRVVDAAQQTVPDDDAYSFLGAAPGDTVYVVPQTQDTEVVWLGWNTQDPEVMGMIDRGITLSLKSVQGPGTMTVYLQSGSFGDPDVLWDSTDASPQSVWVDVNTHTHANWVFTEPGVYLVALTAEADLIDGSHVSDTQVLRFAVGSGTSTDEALAATWDGSSASASPTAGATAAASAAATGAASATTESSSPVVVAVLVGLIALVVVAILVGIGVAIVRSRDAKRRVLSAGRGEGHS